MSEKVIVALDAMGGDNAPVEIVKGAVEAVKEEAGFTRKAGRQGRTGPCRTCKIHLSAGTD